MSSIEDLEISCHVTPLDKAESEDECFSCPMFSIDVVATFMHHNSLMEEEDYDSVLYYGACDVIQHEFYVERERLLFKDQETSMSTLNQILVDMNIPVQYYMLDRILGFARQMADSKKYKDRNVLHMKVEIDVPPGFIDDNDNDNDDDDDDNLDDDSAIRFVPASKSSVDNLEITKVNESTKQQCIICLEELLMGLEVTRLPCLHVYHSGCIVNWLEKRRLCPLCRFEIA